MIMNGLQKRLLQQILWLQLLDLFLMMKINTDREQYLVSKYFFVTKLILKNVSFIFQRNKYI